MCLECNDTGVLCSAPEGETVFCEECARGLTKAIRWLNMHIELDVAFMARLQAMGLGDDKDQAVLDSLYKERGRIEAILREKRREGEFVEMERGQ